MHGLKGKKSNNQGKFKVGGNDSVLNIKCKSADHNAWKRAAIYEGVSKSAWIVKILNNNLKKC